MASSQIIKETVSFFLKMSPRKFSETDENLLCQAYLELFRAVPDKDFRAGCYRYMDEDPYYPPPPNKLAEYIPKRKDDKHGKELRDHFTCKSCGQLVRAITEGQCLDCAGFGPIEYKTTLPECREDPDRYKLEGRVMCNTCGQVGICIQEPTGGSQWRCRQCYTGLSQDEIRKRYTDLVAYGEDKIPRDWMTNDRAIQKRG